MLQLRPEKKSRMCNFKTLKYTQAGRRSNQQSACTGEPPNNTPLKFFQDYDCTTGGKLLASNNSVVGQALAYNTYIIAN